MLHVEWYHVCWPRLTAKRVEPVVSISWASCYVLLVFIAICAVFWLFWLSYQYLPSHWLERLLFCVSLGSWVISLTVLGTSVTNLNEPPRALATSTIMSVPSLLGHCKQKQRGLRGLLCRWPSIAEWEMYITAQGSRLRNDLFHVEWDVKL